MGKYESFKTLPSRHFRRLTGVKRDTFEKMKEMLERARNNRYRKAGRKGRLSIEDKLLMAFEEKKENQKISSERVANENVIGSLKRFKILSDKYRNRRRRFGLRFNLIAGIYNFEIKI